MLGLFPNQGIEQTGGSSTLQARFKIALLVFITINTSSCSKLNELSIGTGYAAKNICSDYFVSGLNLDIIEQRLIAPQIKPLDRIWKIDIDEQNQNVVVSDRIFG